MSMTHQTTKWLRKTDINVATYEQYEQQTKEKLCSGKTLVNEEQRDGPNPLFDLAFTGNGTNKIVKNVNVSVGFIFLLSGSSSTAVKVKA